MAKSFQPLPPPITSEAEWRSCRDPLAMWKCVEDRSSDRKIRLLACGCLRLVNNERSGNEPFLSLAEHLADGTVTADEAEQAHELNERHLWGENIAAWTIFPIVRTAAFQLQGSTSDRLRERLSKTERGKIRANECPEQVLLFRCVFGNPLRPVAFAPAWLTSTVVTLARQMYESHDFGAMPILADALQDAGCDNEDVRCHCQDTETKHVRGCWVVDSILDKQ